MNCKTENQIYGFHNIDQAEELILKLQHRCKHLERSYERLERIKTYFYEMTIGLLNRNAQLLDSIYDELIHAERKAKQ
jgi:hypothetical protein